MMSRTRALPVIALFTIIGAGFVLYQPVLKIGLLSDDYALLMWARRLELLPPDWGQIRPLPILVWSLLAGVTAPARTAVALHACNVALHGVNAALVGLLARRLAGSHLTGFLSALLFLTMPIAVEPVAWGSGVFDVMLATLSLTLAALVTARQQLTPADQGLCLLLSVAMLATKETGVIAGPLVVLLQWVRWGRIDRSALTVGAGQLLLAVGYALTRELTGRLDHRLTPRADLESVGRVVSGIGRAFLMPVHRDIIVAHPALAVGTAVFIAILIGGWLVRSRRSPAARRIAALAAAGTLLCVAPTIRLFGVTPDLQGTRYVYLASAWWSIALGTALRCWDAPRWRIAAGALAVVTLIGSAMATRSHLQPWVAARAERDRVLLRLISLPLSCQQVASSPAPDNVAGAYVFRNGLNEALATLGRSYDWVTPERAAPECRVDLAR